LTLDEMLSKTCHRTIGPDVISAAGDMHESTNCIGEACMACKQRGWVQPMSETGHSGMAPDMEKNFFCGDLAGSGEP
jgi:hypothetical protein